MTLALMATNLADHNHRVQRTVRITNWSIYGFFALGLVYLGITAYFGTVFGASTFVSLAGLTLVFFVLGLTLLFARDYFLLTEERLNLMHGQPQP